MTSLRGTLNSVDLANIFQMLSLNQREGTLYISDGLSRKAIYFGQEGVSMLSRGKGRPDTLGRILLRYDRISPEQLQSALQQQESGSGRLLGQVLVELSLVTRDQVEEALRIQIEEEIYSLFIWKDARFEFVEGAPDPEFQAVGDLARLTFSVNGLIVEAAQRVDEWEWIQTMVRSQGEIFRYTGANINLDDDIFEKSYAGKVLAAVDGKRSVDELIEVSFVNRFDVCKILSLLLDGGALEPVPVNDLHREAQAAINDADTQSAVKFLSRMVELEADTPDLHRQLAEALEGELEYERAAFHYRVYAEVKADEGDVHAAFQTYRRIIELLPTELAATDRMIEVFASNTDGLEEHAAEVIEHGKQLADIYKAFKRSSRAVQVLHRVVALGPTDLDLRHRLIEVYLSCGMPNEAVSEYEALAESAMAVGNLDEAERIFRKILTIERGREDIHSRIAQIQGKRRRKEKGAKGLITAVLVLAALGGAGWWGVNYFFRQQAVQLAEASSADEQFETIDQRYAPTTARLNELSTVLGKHTGDVEGLLGVMLDEKEQRDTAKAQARSVVNDFRGLSAAFPQTRAAKKCDEMADSLETRVRHLEGRELNAARMLEKEARGIFERANAKRMLNHDIRDLLPEFRRALALATPANSWIKTEDGELCRGIAEDYGNWIQKIDAAESEIDAFLEDDKQVQAFERALAFLLDFPPPELAAELGVPVLVESEPAGARVFDETGDTGIVTPGIYRVKVPLGARLRLESPGFADSELLLSAIPSKDPEILQRRLQRVHSVTLQKEAVWVSEPVGGKVEAAITLVDNQLVVATHGGGTAVLDLSSGRHITGYSSGNPNSVQARPVSYGDVLAIVDTNGRVEFYRRSDGVDMNRPIQIQGDVRADGLLWEGLLIIPETKGRVTAVKLDSQRVAWRYPKPGTSNRPGPFQAAPVLAGGRVYAPCGDGAICVLDPATGELLDEIYLGSRDEPATIVSPVNVIGDVLYAGSKEGHIHRYNLATGQESWSAPAAKDPVTPPLILGNSVFVVSHDGTVSGAKVADGTSVDPCDIDALVTAGAAVADQTLYVGDASGNLTAWRADGGELRMLWKYSLAASGGRRVKITSPPIVVGELVIFGCDDRTVRALRR